jgi:Flp pilus assembly protein TadD
MDSELPRCRSRRWCLGRSRSAAWQNLFWIWLLGLSFAWCAWAETAVLPDFTVENARDYLLAVSESVQTQAGDSAETYFIRARLQSELGKKDKAEHLARKALERDPKRPDINLFLADLFVRKDNLTEASRCLRQALELDPKIAGGYRRLGMVLDRLGDREAARNAFETGIRQSPEDATARLLLGRLLLDQGQTEPAAAHLGKACQLDPELANAFYALSQAQLRMGNHAAAKETLKTFQELKQKEKAVMDAENAALDNARAMRNLAAGFHTQVAEILLQQRRDDLAEAHLRQARLISPQEPVPSEMLAGFYIRSRQLPQARSVYEDLVRLCPNQANYRANLGTLLLQLKDFAAAETELKRALELDSQHPEVLNNLVRYYLSSKTNLPEALAMCRRLVSILPTAANYDLLGWACYANGQIENARAASAKAVELDPANPVIRERNRRLQQVP